MSEISTEAVQTPDAAEATPEVQGTSGLYNLDQFPDEIRSQVEPVFKEFDANVTREFQKRAEAVKAWEPYEQLNIRDYTPDDLQGLLGFAEMAADDEKFKAWVKATAAALDGEAAPAPEAQAPAPVADASQPLTMEQVQHLLDEREQASTAQRQQEAALEAASAQIRDTLDGLRKEHGDNYGLPKVDGMDAEDLILHHATRYPATEQDPIGKAFAELQRLIGGAEQQVFSEKVAESPAPEKGGRADATPPPMPSSFEAASAAAKEHLRQALAT